MKAKRVLATVAVALLFITSVTACSQGGSDEASFEGGPGMLFFYSPDCPICQKMKPIVGEMEKEYGGDFKIVRVNVDTTQGKNRARAHGVIGQPTFLIFSEDNEEVRRLMGEQEREVMSQSIENVLGD